MSLNEVNFFDLGSVSIRPFPLRRCTHLGSETLLKQISYEQDMVLLLVSHFLS